VAPGDIVVPGAIRRRSVTSVAEAPSRLARRLGLGDAVVVGLGSMLGAGVFTAFGPAARAAGAGIGLALALAGVVAWCNATSSAALAAVHPESGGTYAYARRRLGPAWGVLAGAAFVTGKIASCAAMALTAGTYAAPDAARPLALAAVAALTAVNLAGVTRTVRVTRVLLALVLAVLAAVVVASLAGGAADADNLDLGLGDDGFLGLLEAAGILFFAFAGYARIATLGEEVVDPARTIPRAIPLALGITLAVYAVVLAATTAVLGPDGLAASEAPLAAAVDAGDLDAALTADDDLHAVLLDRCGNAAVAATAARFAPAIRRLERQRFGKAGHPSVELHDRLIAACARHDVDAAVATTTEIWTALLSELEETPDELV
jgi:APA family basic amino acid/polyamine antiporter